MLLTTSLNRKATTFGDDDTARAVMNANYAREQKRLRRTVHNFEEQTWNNLCREIAKKGSIGKFNQKPVLKEYLVNTGYSMLADGSAYDQQWGIGLSAGNSNALIPDRWTG